MKFPSTPACLAPLANIAMLPAVLGKVRRKLFLVPLVIGPTLGRMFRGMTLAPAPHRLACFVGAVPDPLATIRATPIKVLVGTDLTYQTNDVVARGQPREERGAATVAAA